MQSVSIWSILMKKTSVPKATALAIILMIPMMMNAKKTESRSASRSVTAMLSESASAEVIFREIGLDQAGLSEHVFQLAYKGFNRLREKGMLGEDSILTIIDFTKSSKEKRLYVVDLKEKDLKYHSLVAHGRNSGMEYAQRFSNKPSSHQSSLGFYITKESYWGGNGYSLKLLGVEKGFNDRALARSIVIHGASYANEEVVQNKGYLGRSYGCPAIPEHLTKPIIDKIKGGNGVFVYYPERNYLIKSSIING